MVVDRKIDFLGDHEDQEFIRSYLLSLRQITPHEMFLTEKPLSLKAALNDGVLLNAELFQNLLDKAVSALTDEFAFDITLVDTGRYYLGLPKAEDHFGGFHSPKSVGYQDMYQAACSVQPNTKHIKNMTVRTFEVMRCYLHDSLHHSTFCSYRRARRTPLSSRDAKHLMPFVYRYQYGINFRNSLGQTYSSPELSYKSPYAINVNLLMDGAIVLTVADIVSRYVGRVRRSDLSRSERMMIDDIVLSSDYAKPNVWGEDFYFQVTQPVQRFIDHWGGDHMRRLVIQAMISGDLSGLTAHFDERFGEEGAWEKVFRQPGFRFDGDR